MPVPRFIADLRARIGHDPLWLIGITAVVVRGADVLLVARADNGAWTPVTGIVDPGDEESTDAGWYPLDDLPAMSTHMRDRISTALDGRSDTRFAWAGAAR